MAKSSYIYILANRRYGTIYTGVTVDLVKRTWQHKDGFVEGFAKQHSIKQLVWYEVHEDLHAAIKREKQIKKWNRVWKIRLIQEQNPQWRDLYPEVVG